MKSLKEMQAEVRAVNEENGWYGASRTFGDGIALLHSEVSEALEAYRVGGTDDLTIGTSCKPEGVGSEYADILIRLLDECERYGIDLDFEYARKIDYNKTRGHRHGGKAL